MIQEWRLLFAMCMLAIVELAFDVLLLAMQLLAQHWPAVALTVRLWL